MISLTDVVVFLLLVIVFLLVKLMRANKDKFSSAAAAGETGTTTEPLLGGIDALYLCTRILMVWPVSIRKRF